MFRGAGSKVAVLSRGMAECLQVLQETLEFLKERQIAAHVLPTKTQWRFTTSLQKLSP
jgi:hypothetical protein